MKILTDEEIVAVDDDLFEQSKVTRLELSRAIEAAILAKLGDPVAWQDKDLCILHEDERETPIETLTRMGWTPLYRLPEVK